MFDKGWLEWSKPESWVKVIVRGFGLRRDVYAAIGGFECRYDRFAEWLLAARLRVGGYRSGSCTRRGRSTPLRRLVCRVRRRDRQVHAGRVLVSSGMLITAVRPNVLWLSTRMDRRARNTGTGQTALIARSVRRVRGELDVANSNWRMAVRDRVRPLATGMLEGERLLLKHRAAVWAAQIRFWLSLNGAQRDRAFEDYYMATTSLCRVRFALAQPAQALEDETSVLDYPLDVVDDVDLYGFHGLEAFGQERFRWSGSVAAVRLRLEANDFLATVQLVGVRVIDPDREVVLFVDEARITEVCFDRDSWRLNFRLPSAALAAALPHWLIIRTTCAARYRASRPATTATSAYRSHRCRSK